MFTNIIRTVWMSFIISSTIYFDGICVFLKGSLEDTFRIYWTRERIHPCLTPLRIFWACVILLNALTTAAWFQVNATNVSLLYLLYMYEFMMFYSIKRFIMIFFFFVLCIGVCPVFSTYSMSCDDEVQESAHIFGGLPKDLFPFVCGLGESVILRLVNILSPLSSVDFSLAGYRHVFVPSDSVI